MPTAVELRVTPPDARRAALPGDFSQSELAAPQKPPKTIQEYLFGDPDRPMPEREIVERNRDAMLAANPWAENEPLQREATRIANENASRQTRANKLIRLIDRLGEALAPHVACKKGCDQCCHISTIIFESEARRIADSTGRAMVNLPLRHPERVRADTERFYRQACPFLKDRACSIYEIRPSSCRQHHSLNATPDQCNLDIPPDESSVPAYNGMKLIELPYVWLKGPNDALGDIREFSPADV